MSAHIEGIPARYAEISATAQPYVWENEVACIRITSQFSGDGAMVEGRPEDLLRVAREFLRAAELIVEQTMRDPNLRRLYAISDMSEVFADESEG